MLNNSRRHNRPHSPGIRVGNLIFVSGMVPLDPETGESKLGPTREQVELVLSNMSHLLESAGTSLRNVVKLNVSMANMLERDTLFRVMRRFFPTYTPRLHGGGHATQQWAWRRNRMHRHRLTDAGFDKPSAAPPLR